MGQTEDSQRLKSRLSDQIWRLNNLYWITNEKGIKLKLHLNWVQRQILKNMWFLNIILKSRQHGVTTFFCIFFLDICLFNSNIRAGIIAHNREDAEAFFKDKVKFAYDNLPEGIKASRIADTSNAREIAFNNNSIIRVGTSLRSSTLQYLHVSEFGKICKDFPEKAKEIVTGAFNTVAVGQFIAIESTAEGKDGYFFNYCQEAIDRIGKLHSKLEFKFHFYAWWEDPKNTVDPKGVIIVQEILDYIRGLQSEQKIQLDAGQQAWYYLKWKQLGELIKKEQPSFVDEAFESAIEGSYYITQMRKIKIENRICKLPLLDGFQVSTWWDLGVNDAMTIWFTQIIGREIRVIDYYENSGEGFPFYAKVLRDRKYDYGSHNAPFDINVKEMGTGKTRIQSAKELGIKFTACAKIPLADGIEAVRRILSYCWFDEVKCHKGINHLKDYRKEWNEKLGCYRDQPLHNAASHGADGFRTLAVGHNFTDSGQSLDKRFRPRRHQYSNKGYDALNYSG